MMPTPYEIHIPEQSITDTRAQLRHTRKKLRESRLPASLPTDGERYGADRQLIDRILDYWAEEFTWRAWEDKLNSHPHFIENIDGLDLHFWHIRGTNPDSTPLLLLHGWPGSAIEYWNLIGPLTDPASHGAPEAPSFDVVIAELPGFGFSGKPTEPGWGPNRIAAALNTLMTDALGYEKYGIHGEDWGTLIGARVARNHSDSVAALQVTMPFTGPYGDHIPTPEWGGQIYAATGYLHVQSLVPDALTIGMIDSPVALTAWIIEKFSAWSDSPNGLDATFGLDVLVANLHFYWLTDSIVSATRLYRESALEGIDVIGPPQIEVPASILAFPKEPFASPREWLEGVYDIQRYTQFDEGGHFAALEKPDNVLTEIREFFPTFIGGK